MTQEDRAVAADDLAGLSVEDAAAAAVAQDSSRDRDEARAVLETVADDEGVVTREAVDDALGHVSKVVATPETRVELAARDLESARETASHVTDLDSVQAKLDAFEARLSAAEDHTEALGPDLQAVVERQGDSGDIYDIAADIRRITTGANEAQKAADDLKLDVEDFEKWVGSQSVRFRQLDEEVEVAGERLDELADALDREWTDDDARDWVDVRFQHRVMGLMLADLRQTFADLKRWADREDLDPDDRTDSVATGLADAADRHADLGVRLEELARPEWRERFADPLHSFEDAVDDFEAPIPWGEVEATLADHRERVAELA
ncbi:hypothetical protein [Haloarchaeobius amylolyticus]|uniref:hypothetical protein n=1 Tax=Haloarchaeobius amylolyticus TaxID=1198296 RepID=UPI00226F7A1F|nr:hypothetical protein [Haloarchaeobius amylolyticus]